MNRIPPMLVPLLLLACGGGGGPAVMVSDSAGVTIVENNAPAWERGDAWTVDDEPLAVIGDDPALALQVVGSVVRLPGDAMVVSDPPSGRILIFDSAGTHVRTVGGRGEADGRFQQLAGLALLPPDSILVYDRALGRLSVLDSAGSFVRAFPGPSGGSGYFSIRLRGVTGDRRAFFGPLEHTHAVAPWLPARVLESTAPLRLLELDGAVEDTIPEAHRIEHVGGDSPGPRIFGASTVSEAGPDGVYVASPDTFEVRVYGREGLRRVARRAQEPRRVTDRDIEREIDRRLAPLRRAPEGLPEQEVERQIREERTRLEGHPFPEHMAAVSDLVVDGEGNAWVRAYTPPAEDGPGEWTVFDAEGRWLGEVELPGSFLPGAIARDRIIGVAFSETGLQRVLVLRLDRNE